MTDATTNTNGNGSAEVPATPEAPKGVTITLSPYIAERVRSLQRAEEGESFATCLGRVITKGLYGLGYQEVMQERKKLQEKIGKAVVKGKGLEDIQDLVARLQATYKS